MSADKIIFEKPVKKSLRRLPSHIHGKILLSFHKIKSNPVLGVKLHGELENYYKMRVGDYRIVYSFDVKKSLIIIVKIEHRQGVYR